MPNSQVPPTRDRALALTNSLRALKAGGLSSKSTARNEASGEANHGRWSLRTSSSTQVGAGSCGRAKVPRRPLPYKHAARSRVPKKRSKQLRRLGQRIQRRRSLEVIKKTWQTVVDRFAAHRQFSKIMAATPVASSVNLACVCTEPVAPLRCTMVSWPLKRRMFVKASRFLQKLPLRCAAWQNAAG